MADEKFSKADWDAIAQYIEAEQRRREAHPHRLQLERDWKEIDRQLAMEPRQRKLVSGQEADWLPNQELPLQSTALEVIMADASRMKFPRGKDWYEAHAHLTVEYEQRFQESTYDLYQKGEPSSEPIRLDQETADTLVKATLDHYHSMYEYRQHWGLLDADAIKYGTYVGCVREVLIPKFDVNVSNVVTKNLRAPVMIPQSIKAIFLDDTPMSVMHEGVSMSGAIIRRFYQRLDDLRMAIKAGGNKNGWMASALKNLEPIKRHAEDEKRGHLEMLEWEGDISVSRSSGSPLYLPSARIQIAVGNGGPRVVRYQEVPRGSYFVGHYLRDRRNSPYGSSPLMKGRPIQETASEVLNRLGAVAILNAEPPVSYDGYDSKLMASGGPIMAPGSTIAVENINNLKTHEFGDASALLQVYLALLKQYEDVTAVNAPRIGAQSKSHQTAFAIDTEQARGQIRTENYVSAQLHGPMPLALEKEYEIAKRIMRTPQPVLIDGNGMEGWRMIKSDQLPDRVAFTVHGALGPLNEREQLQAFVGAVQQSLQLIGTGTQLGLPTPQIDLDSIVRELFEKAGVNDAGRFIIAPGGTEAVPGPAQVGAGVQAIAPLLQGLGGANPPVAA